MGASRHGDGDGLMKFRIGPGYVFSKDGRRWGVFWLSRSYFVWLRIQWGYRFLSIGWMYV